MVVRCVAFLGRFFLSLLFLSSAISGILNWEGAEDLLVGQLSSMASAAVHLPWVLQLVDIALPLAPLLLAVSIGIELVGGLALLLGIGIRLGAGLLVLVWIPMTVVMHHFWFMPEPDRTLQAALFLKNIAVLGGLFLLLAYGKGKLSAPPSKSSSGKKD